MIREMKNYNNYVLFRTYLDILAKELKNVISHYKNINK